MFEDFTPDDLPDEYAGLGDQDEFDAWDEGPSYGDYDYYDDVETEHEVTVDGIQLKIVSSRDTHAWLDIDGITNLLNPHNSKTVATTYDIVSRSFPDEVCHEEEDGTITIGYRHGLPIWHMVHELTGFVKRHG